MPAPAAPAASLIVNTLLDNTTNGDGLCTLREAITAANNNANFNDCTGSSYGADIITFSVSGTITLGSSLPNITAVGSALTIDGTGQTVTLSDGGAVGVLTVSPGGSLTLNNLTIANGLASGGIGSAVQVSTGKLIANGVNFQNNAGSSAGGAIEVDSDGMVNVSTSSFSGNNSFYGGAIAIYSGSTVTITGVLSKGTLPPRQAEAQLRSRAPLRSRSTTAHSIVTLSPASARRRAVEQLPCSIRRPALCSTI